MQGIQSRSSPAPTKSQGLVTVEDQLELDGRRMFVGGVYFGLINDQKAILVPYRVYGLLTQIQRHPSLYIYCDIINIIIAI